MSRIIHLDFLATAERLRTIADGLRVEEREALLQTAKEYEYLALKYRAGSKIPPGAQRENML